MPILTVTAKGQVTLKQDLLKHLGVQPGQKIEADKLPDGRIVVKAAAQDGSISDFVGCLSHRSLSPSIQKLSRCCNRKVDVPAC